MFLKECSMYHRSRFLIGFGLILVLVVSLLVSLAAVGAQEDTSTCAGVDIIFFPGGSPGGPFETVVYNGAVHAAEELGANVQYIWSDWDPQKMVTQLNEAVATNPDGIAIMGHPGDE